MQYEVGVVSGAALCLDVVRLDALTCATEDVERPSW